jgi:hypothetical protein
MNHTDFQKLINDRVTKIKRTLSDKAKEYASNEDLLHNFKAAGRINKTSPEKALMGMALKHLVSVMDLVNELPDEPGIVKLKTTEEKYIDEKVGDMVNYLILLEALLTERCKTVPAYMTYNQQPDDSQKEQVDGR